MVAARRGSPLFRQISSDGGVMVATVGEALAAWGAYDRDDPFPLFAAVRELRRGARGHAGRRARRVAGGRLRARPRRAQRSAAVEGHARRARRRAARSWPRACPGPAFARHMLGVDPPDHTRLRRLVAAAFSLRRIEALRPQVQAIVDDLLDAIAAAGDRTPRSTSSRAFAFPLPFTVICELLGVPEPDRAALGRGLTALLVPDVDARRVRTGEAGVRRGRRDADSARRREAGQPRRRPRERADQRPRRRRAARAHRSCSRRSSS